MGYIVIAGGDTVGDGPVKVLDCAARLLSEQPGTSRHGEVDFLLSRNQENVQGIVTCRKTRTRGPCGFLQLPVSRDLQRKWSGFSFRGNGGFAHVDGELEVAVRVESAKPGKGQALGNGGFQKAHVPVAGAFTIARPLV